jgi:Zn-dependent protease
MEAIFVIFQLIVLIISAIIHEISHGAMANRLGDPTAKAMGRLSLNPMKHLDPVGSFLVPLLLWITTSGSFVFGWAKPVPINPYNIRDQKYGEAKIALAGPASNLILATVFGIALRNLPQTSSQLIALGNFFSIVVLINILLAVFNLIPIPPLDGSKILGAFVPVKYLKWQRQLEQNRMIVLIVVVLLAPYIVWPVVSVLYRFLVGA